MSAGCTQAGVVASSGGGGGGLPLWPVTGAVPYLQCDAAADGLVLQAGNAFVEQLLDRVGGAPLLAQSPTTRFRYSAAPAFGTFSGYELRRHSRPTVRDPNFSLGDAAFTICYRGQSRTTLSNGAGEAIHLGDNVRFTWSLAEVRLIRGSRQFFKTVATPVNTFTSFIVSFLGGAGPTQAVNFYKDSASLGSQSLTSLSLASAPGDEAFHGQTEVNSTPFLSKGGCAFYGVLDAGQRAEAFAHMASL